MAKSQGTPRVRELLDEMSQVLRDMRDEVSEGNSKPGGVLDFLLMQIEEAQTELDKREASLMSLMPIVRMIADLIEFIGKIQDTLSYIVCCLTAAIHRKRNANDYWEKHKIIKDFSWA